MSVKRVFNAWCSFEKCTNLWMNELCTIFIINSSHVKFVMRGHRSPWHKIQQPTLHNKDMEINHTTIVNWIEVDVHLGCYLIDIVMEKAPCQFDLLWRIFQAPKHSNNLLQQLQPCNHNSINVTTTPTSDYWNLLY
jgi:hypothetical protein